MKKLIVSLFLMLPSLGFPAGGVTVGDGGDSTSSRGLSVDEIQTRALKAKDVLISLINMMDLEAQDPNFNSRTPDYYAKLFNHTDTLVEMLASAQLYVYKDQSCHDHEGNEKDASANQVPNPHICLSASRLQSKVSSADAFVKLGGLLAHEYSHLAGTNETEAQNFQAIVEEKLTSLSLDQWEKFNFWVDGSVDTLNFLYAASLPSDTAARDWKTSCDDANVADQYFVKLLPNMAAFSRYGVKKYAAITETYLRHKLVHEYVCKQAGTPIDEMDRAALEIIFGTEAGVYMDAVDTDALVLLGIIFNVSRAHTYVSKINNDDELEKVISHIATQF